MILEKITKLKQTRKGAAGGESMGTITKMLLMIGFVAIAALIMTRFYGTTFPQLNIFTTFMGGL